MRERSPATVLALACALAAVLGAACRSAGSSGPVASYPPLESSSFGSMNNVSMSGPLSGAIWFGSTPSEGDMELVRRRGVKLVIDLSTAEEYAGPAAREACERYGIVYRSANMPSFASPSDEQVDFVLEALAQEGSAPLLLFCGTGGRCAMFVAMYRNLRMGVPLDEALAEARRAGMRPEDEDFVRAQIERILREHKVERGLRSQSIRAVEPSPA